MVTHKLVGRWQHLPPIPCPDGSTFEVPSVPRMAVYFRCPNRMLAGSIDFLIDTGADVTTIMPDDRDNITIPGFALSDGYPNQMAGVGGTVPIKYLLNVTFEFKNDSGLTVGPIPLERIGVLCPSPQHRRAYQGVPSLLGRDFLNRCNCEFSKFSIILNLTEAT